MYESPRPLAHLLWHPEWPPISVQLALNVHLKQRECWKRYYRFLFLNFRPQQWSETKKFTMMYSGGQKSERLPYSIMWNTHLEGRGVAHIWVGPTYSTYLRTHPKSFFRISIHWLFHWGRSFPQGLESIILRRWPLKAIAGRFVNFVKSCRGRPFIPVDRQGLMVF